MESNQKQSKSFGNYGVFFTIAGLYLSGVATIISERKNDGRFLDTISPWLGWFCVASATVLLVTTIINIRKKKQS